jgi:hypothetical protein
MRARLPILVALVCSIVAMAAVAVTIASDPASASRTSEASVPGCLTVRQASLAMGVKWVDRLPGCSFSGGPDRLHVRKVLVIDVYDPGLPGWKAFAKAVCDVSDDACKYAKQLTVERNPIRYMRLLFAALDHEGFTNDVSAEFPGRGPAFLWDPDESTGFSGSALIFYVVQKKRFASAFCHAIYAKPNSRDEECAFAAGRFVYLNLTA